MTSLLTRIDKKSTEPAVTSQVAQPVASAAPLTHPDATGASGVRVDTVTPTAEAEQETKWRQFRQWMIDKVMVNLPSSGELTRTPQSNQLVSERIAAVL